MPGVRHEPLRISSASADTPRPKLSATRRSASAARLPSIQIPRSSPALTTRAAASSIRIGVSATTLASRTQPGRRRRRPKLPLLRPLTMPHHRSPITTRFSGSRRPRPRRRFALRPTRSGEIWQGLRAVAGNWTESMGRSASSSTRSTAPAATPHAENGGRNGIVGRKNRGRPPKAQITTTSSWAFQRAQRNPRYAGRRHPAP